ncbi:trafficking protein particle complex subunit 10-like [Ciona intestinalis]
MENKPTITYSISNSSNEGSFLTLSTRLTESLSKLKVEWKRTYGRSSHELYLNVKIVPLTSALLEQNDLVTRPYFHIFWTDCNDVDLYRSSIREEISSWINLLSSHKAAEWIIVIVASDVLSRLTKAKLQLPRTSIADKVKAEFCPKNPERLQVLFDPMRESAKSAESWSALGTKVATTTVRCMETIVSKYEDKVRSERERRNEKTWDFCSYFILQEELAFMYEMLGMCGNALVQYDELDAMFTQYVLNANAGEVAHWLSKFSEPITRWHSLLLWKRVDNKAREAILGGHASLIEIRNYLFTRLCHLLFKMGKVREVTQRMHYFLHSIVTEVEILEINVPPGALACWIFMCCLELVDALKAKSQNSDENSTKNSNSDMGQEKLVLENAGLWNLARLKLYYLGQLCGLQPGVETSSDHLHVVVDLLGGMGDAEERDQGHLSPSLVLREALSSKSNFKKHYFELSELAMGTYKHMKRYRAARSIGSDLAEFYLLEGEPYKAEGYFLETVNMYQKDGWNSLCAQSNMRLAECYKKMMNIKKYLKLCYTLMCDNALSDKKKKFYSDEYRSLSTDLGDKILSLNLWPLATVTSIQFIPAQTSFRIQTTQEIELSVISHAPKPILFQKLEVTLEHSKRQSCEDNISVTSTASKVSFDSEPDGTGFFSPATKKPLSHPTSAPVSPEPRRSRHRRHPSSSSSRDLMTQQIGEIDDSGKIELVSLNPDPQTTTQVTNLSLHDQTEYTKDGALSWSGITCRRSHDLLRRQDSSHSQASKLTPVTTVAMESYDFCLESRQLTLAPGKNTVRLRLKTDAAGTFKLMQLRLNLHKTYFVLPHFYPIINYHVTNTKPTVAFEQEKSLIFGAVQNFTVRLTMGDYDIIEADCSKQLSVTTPTNVQLLSIITCTVQEKDDEIKNVTPCPKLVLDSENYLLPIPIATAQSIVTYQVSCICHVDPITFTLDCKKTHRRTHSAPPVTISRSPKSAPRHQTILELPSPTADNHYDITTEQPDSTCDITKQKPVTLNGSSENEKHENQKNANNIHQNGNIALLDPGVKENSPKTPEKTTPKHRLSLRSPFSRRKTKTPEPDSKPSEKIESDNNIIITPSLRINGDLIEVTLDEDSAASSDGFVTLPSITDVKMGTPYESMESGSSGSDSDLELDRKPPLPNKKLIRHIPSKSDAGVVQLHHNSNHKREASRYITTHTFDVTLPWNEVPPKSLSLRFVRCLEFTHAWHFFAVENRMLSVTVDNVTSQTILLRDARLRFVNASHMGVVQVSSLAEKKIKPNSNIVYCWCVSTTKSMPLRLHAQFDIDVVSQDITNEVITSTATYKFELENIQPIYNVTCVTGNGTLRSGEMTSLRIDLRRVRVDSEHETTKNGQQLLMFQVVDNRGRWAVCGKSSGVISLPTSNAIQCENQVEAMGSATLEVMPLISGNLHLPFVILNRYMKRRSSEFDERLSSTDSPVLKPPRLRPFEQGEVVYADQARQVRVFPHDYVIDEKRVTQL